MTSKKDLRLDGREPEFAVMSRRPGIGSAALAPFIETLNTSAGALYIARHGDVPNAFMIDGKQLPIGPHLRGLLRLEFFGDHRRPQSAKDKANEHFYKEALAQHEVFHVPVGTTTFQMARALDTLPTGHATDYQQRLQAKALQIAARQRINLSRRNKL